VEAKGNHQAIICRIDREPDESWADDMAEIAYQARSALDVLIPQLVVDSGNTAQRGTQFPIFSDQAAYVTPGRNGKSKRDTMLKGVASRYRKVIEDAQPYQRGRGAYRDPLAILQTISNRDKHNDVYVCVAAAETFAIKLVRPPLPAPEHKTTIRFGDRLTPYAMADGQEIFAVDWNPDPT
jgi:phage terminase large subunit GpA-like protein